MPSVYILFSESIQRFYIGSTEFPVEHRLQQHLLGHFPGAFTSQTNDWQIFLAIPCTSVPQARQIELHLKKQKSSRYLRQLASYPEMIQNLLRRFP